MINTVRRTRPPAARQRVGSRVPRSGLAVRADWAARGDDRGSICVELALSVPLVVLLLFLVIGALNLARSNLDVHAAATAAARAGSITRSPAAATAAAQNAATANLAGHCAGVAVAVDTSQFTRGGQLTVTVGCTVTTHGLTGVGVPGQMTVSATSSSPVDVYRNIISLGPADADRPGRLLPPPDRHPGSRVAGIGADA